MAEPTPAFSIEGDLLELWNEAVSDFLNSSVAASREPKEKAEYHDASDPGEWLKSFQSGEGKSPKTTDVVRHKLRHFFRSIAGKRMSKKRAKHNYELDTKQFLKTFQQERHPKGEKISSVRTNVGRHLKTIQLVMRSIGFAVDAASVAFPAISPASLVVNAFGWLFDSFIKVSQDFDSIEAFFESFARRLPEVSIVSKHLKQLEKQDETRKCIVELFGSCLDICRIGSEQANHRIKKWVDQLNGRDMLGPELERFNKAEKWLNDRIQGEIFDAVQVTRRFHCDEERSDILEWISTINAEEMHANILTQADYIVVGGDWLLKSELFNSWKGNAFNRIWYTGDPGAGKSVLAHAIIEHLQKELLAPNEHVMVASLYLSYTLKPQPTVTELLGSVLRQFQAGTEAHPEVLSKFQEYRKRGTYGDKLRKPEERHIKQMLTQISKNKKTFVVVDGLDEFEIKGREKLLKSLKEIDANIKILVTSRILHNLKELQRDFRTEKIEAHDEDKDKYIESRIENHSNLRRFPTRHPDIKEQVKRRSGNMFIIVRLHMDAISEVETEDDLEKLLESLPNTLDATYNRTLDRITNQTKGRADRAICTLGWVTYAERLLSTVELQHALALEECLPDGNLKKHVRTQDEILSNCCGFVTITNGNIRYIHKSAREFFDTQRSKETFLNFDKRISITLIKCLTTASDQRVLKDAEIPTPAEFPLVFYAGKYLHIHFRRILNLDKDEDFLQKIYSFVSGASGKLYSARLLEAGTYKKSSSASWGVRNLNRNVEDHLEPLHIAVFLGNPVVVQELVEDKADVNALDPYGQSSVELAITLGLDRVAEVLLNNGAEVSLRTKKGHAVLLHSVEKDYTGVVAQIVRVLRTSPSSQAVKASDKPTAQRSIEQSPQSDPAMIKYISLLKYAYEGKSDNIKSLLDQSALEPINLALLSGDTELDPGSSDSDDEDDEDEEDDNSSSFGSDPGSDESGSSSESQRFDELKRNFLRTACFLAVEMRNRGVVATLLEGGVSPNVTNYQGRSLLQRATAKDDYEMVKLLLASNSDVDQRDKNGRTALMANAGFSSDTVLELLIAQGADKDIRLREGCHELYEAAVFGATAAVKFFLDHGIDASIKNNFGWTPLHGAAANGHYECVKLLLGKDAEPSPLSDTYETPLDFVKNGKQHYDDILSGADHYAPLVLQAEGLSVEAKAENMDEILDLLVQERALTAEELKGKLEESEYLRRGTHPGWSYGKSVKLPWYSDRMYH